MIGRRAWTAYAVVFVASACTLVLEIAAGRLLAPYFGVSLYTWTSIIGVVLAGIALGNYLGGLVADLAGSRRTLGLVLAAAGMASLAILPFTTIDLLGLVPRGLPLVARMVLAQLPRFSERSARFKGLRARCVTIGGSSRSFTGFMTSWGIWRVR